MRNKNLALSGKEKSSNQLILTVNGNGSNYIARLNGKSASCTYSAKVAAERVCLKVWPDGNFELTPIGEERFPGGSKSTAEFGIKLSGQNKNNRATKDGMDV